MALHECRPSCWCWCHSLGDGLVAVPDGLQEPFARLLVLGSAAQPVPLLLQRRHLHTQQRHLWAERGCETRGCSGKCTSVCGGESHMDQPAGRRKSCVSCVGLLVLVPPSMKCAACPAMLCHRCVTRMASVTCRKLCRAGPTCAFSVTTASGLKCFPSQFAHIL